MTDEPPIAGAILAGGASRRMGRDKAFVEIDGVPMVSRVAAVLTESGCSSVVVVGGDAAALGRVGLERIDDAWPGEGPLGGVITALRWAGGPVLVVACDLPDLSVGAVRALLGTARRQDVRPVAAEAPGPGLDGVDGVYGVDVVVADGGRLEPLLAVWSHAALGRLEDRFVVRGERAVHRVLEGGPGAELTVCRVPIDPAVVRNVNSPVDVLGRRSS
ncbi:MAG: hypothetical protein RI958_2863 [Actinomycetota bacterium]